MEVLEEAKDIILEEAKEIMTLAGCKKAFVVYELELEGIAEVRECNNKEESVELERKVENLLPTIEAKWKINYNEPIECPLDPSMNKYLEFRINKTIKPCNIQAEEYEQIENRIKPLLEKYKWKIIDN